jgi:polar amino acid transport system substrate-binding protein
MKKAILWVSLSVSIAVFLLQPHVLRAQDKVLIIDIRHRPPDMIVEGEKFSGPLLDIIEEAAQKIDYRVQYQERQFEGSLHYLSQGKIDILPRTICTRERAANIDYLGPIGYQKKESRFLVKQGRKNAIQRFEDLKGMTVGIKRGTVYFEQFDASQEMTKIQANDDENLVAMFVRNRFDTMIVLDKPAVEAALKKHQVTDYAYARYSYPLLIGIYYGIVEDHPEKERLQQILEEMALSGRVNAIYESYSLEPPFFDIQITGFQQCFPE